MIGTVRATVKDVSLEAGRLMIVQPLDGDRRISGAPLIAVDTIGAGEGEIVLYVTSYEAAIPWKRRKPGLTLAATDASIVGIVDPEPRS